MCEETLYLVKALRVREADSFQDSYWYAPAGYIRGSVSQEILDLQTVPQGLPTWPLSGLGGSPLFKLVPVQETPKEGLPVLIWQTIGALWGFIDQQVS